MNKAEIIGKINDAEQKATRRWMQMLTMSIGEGRDRLERDVDALDAEARIIIWTVMQMGYDIERDDIGAVTDIVSR